METYTYSEARQHFSDVLNNARHNGAVCVRRRDGTMFQITPVATEAGSPFDVGTVDVKLTREEILMAVRESRARF